MKTMTFFVTSALGFIAGYILTNSTTFNLCRQTEYSCRDSLNNFGDPLFYGAGALALVFLALLIFKKAYPAWKKFAVWFVPLAALLFVFYPEPGSGDLFSPDPETVFKWVSGLYVLVSLVIIAIAYTKKK